MMKMKSNDYSLIFLEELRKIAQLGLNYTRDKHDKERYSRLLDLSCKEYARISKLGEKEILKRFRSELGHITPKVGLDGAIFNELGEILLIKRSDDNLWCLPCGWAELNESPVESLKREIKEEINLNIKVKKIINIYSRMPGDYGQPHTSYHILFHCLSTGKQPSTSDEVIECGFYDYRKITKWHRDHRIKAKNAVEYFSSFCT